MIIEKIIMDFINNASMGLVIFDSNEKLVTANSRIIKIVDAKLEELKGMNATEFVRNFFIIENKPCQYINCKNDKQVVFAKRNNSSYIMRCFYVSKIFSKTYFVLSVVDVSDIKEYKESVANSRGIALMRSIIEFIPDILFVINTKGRVIVWNKTAEEMTGVPKERMLGKGSYEYAIPFYKKRRPILIDFALAGKEPDKRYGYESVKYEKDTITAITENAYLEGKKKILWGKARRFYDYEGNLIGALEVVRDVTEMKKMEKKLKYLAERDPLTNTFNRRQFEILLKHEIARAERTNEPITLIYLDVDNLKEINDRYGHRKGDELLMKIANVLLSGLRKSDIIARVGGDEFIIVTPNLKKEGAERLINRLRRKIIRESKNFPYTIDFSYGAVEIMPNAKLEIDKIVANADMEMYRMKKLKKAGSNP